MCCTTRMVPGKSGGSCANKNSRACGPPVEIPMATIRVGGGADLGDALFSVRGGAPRKVPGRTTLQSAAALIFAINSRAVSAMCTEASCGLVTKSKAPSPRALNVMEAPSVECELTTITGNGCRRMISFKVSMPFMPGICRSSVTTWGCNSSIFFRQKFPSIAVPTTSMEGSTSSICGISFRIKAESSTTSTRTLFRLTPDLPLHSVPAVLDRSGSAIVQS